MKVLSLFSGVGGFDLGLEASGMETVALCEWDRHAQNVLRRHWPHVPLYGDVSELTGAQLIADGVRPDVVAFGSPCQDLSVAGKRAGLQGERSGLFHEAVRIIRELRDLTDGTLPRWVIWENVVGALNSNGGADFQAVLDEMGNLGAHLIEWAVLDAQNYGIPQRRRRVFLVSCLDPRTAARCPDPLLPVGEGSPRDLETLRKAWKNSPTGARGRAPSVSGRGGYVRDIVGTLTSGAHPGGLNGQDAYTGQIVVESVVFENSYRDGPRINDEGIVHTRAAYADLDIEARDPWPNRSADDFETWEEDRPAPTLNAFDNGDIRATTLAVQDIAQPVVARGGKGIDADGAATKLIAYGISGNVIGRQDHNGPNGISVTQEDGAMFTLTATDRHAVAYGFDGMNQKLNDDIHHALRVGRDSSDFVLDPRQPLTVVRRLTPRECERLMGWPDDWTRWTDDGREQADSHRYKQIGNGVASPVALWVGRQIFAAEHLA